MNDNIEILANGLVEEFNTQVEIMSVKYYRYLCTIYRIKFGDNSAYEDRNGNIIMLLGDKPIKDLIFSIGVFSSRLNESCGYKFDIIHLTALIRALKNFLDLKSCIVQDKGGIDRPIRMLIEFK